MKKILTTIGFASLTALSCLSIATPPSQAQLAPGERGFWCDTSTNIPRTMYQNSQGNKEPWIEWKTSYFQGSGYSPLRRCQEVSARLETYRVNKQLKFITAGRMNRQNVLCTAIEFNGPCVGLIYTLRPHQNPIKTLNKFLAWADGAAGLGSLSESGGIPYIDVTERLGEDVEEKIEISPLTTPLNVPRSTENIPEQPRNNQGIRRDL